MLQLYGIGRQPAAWHVLEPKPIQYARIYWILDGTTRFYSGGATLPLQHNHLYIFPTRAPYEMTTDPADPLYCLFLHLDLHAAGLMHPISIDLSADAEFRHLMLVWQDAIAADYPVSYLEHLAEAFEGLCLARRLFQAVDAEARQWMALIQQTYLTDIPLQQLASGLGYTTEAFIRRFRQQVGMSPHQYAISLRMQDAVQLLTRDLSLDELAQNVGYADGHSFAGAFRRYYGISPTAYRRLYAGYV